MEGWIEDWRAGRLREEVEGGIAGFSGSRTKEVSVEAW